MEIDSEATPTVEQETRSEEASEETRSTKRARLDVFGPSSTLDPTSSSPLDRLRHGYGRNPLSRSCSCVSTLRKRASSSCFPRLWTWKTTPSRSAQRKFWLQTAYIANEYHSRSLDRSWTTCRLCMTRDSPIISQPADHKSIFFGAYSQGPLVGLRTQTRRFPMVDRLLIAVIYTLCGTQNHTTLFLARNRAMGLRSDHQNHKAVRNVLIPSWTLRAATSDSLLTSHNAPFSFL